MCIAPFPENHKEHLILIRFLPKSHQKDKEVPNDFDHDDADIEGQALRGDEDDGLLGKGMRPAS